MGRGARDRSGYRRSIMLYLDLELFPRVVEYMQAQSIGPGDETVAIKQLLNMALASTPAAGVVSHVAHRAITEMRQYVFERLNASFSEVRRDLAEYALAQGLVLRAEQSFQVGMSQGGDPNASQG